MLELLDSWQPPPLDRRTRARARLAAAARRGPCAAAALPAAELRPRGSGTAVERDARAVRHHYDVSNEFFALFLGESMTYSCAIFSRGADTLEEAQEAKLELVCRKLELAAGPARARRRLRLGQLRHPRRPRARRPGDGHHAVRAAGRAGPPARGRGAGLADRVEIRVADYRELTRRALRRRRQHRHGRARRREPDRRVRAAARAAAAPGGRLLNHGIARLRTSDARGRPLLGALRVPRRRAAAPLAHPVGDGARRAGRREHVEGFRDDYAETLAHWARDLDDNLDEAIRLAGPERMRVWRLYLRAARRGFESGFTSIYQVRARRPGAVNAEPPAENGASRAPVAARA